MPIFSLELDLMVNVAYIFLLAAYLMRDILWLRVLAVLASCLVIPYYYFQVQALWPPIAWNAAFALINICWIARLMNERRPVHFTPEEQRLYDKALRTLKPCQARNLFEAARWKVVPRGARIVAQGQPMNTLSLIAGGRFTLEKDDIIVDEVGEGRFIGSYTFLKNIKDAPAPVSFIAAEPSRLAEWDNDKLRGLIDDDTQLSMAVEASLGLELAQLLDHSRNDLEFALRIDRIAKKQIRRETARRAHASTRAVAG